MGFLTVVHILEQQLEISAGQKMVLMALAQHVKDNKAFQDLECWPGITRLSKMASMSDRSVNRAITELSKLGYISIIEAGGGSKKTNRYRLNIKQLEHINEAPETLTDCHPLEPQNEAINRDQTLTNCPKNPDRLSRTLTNCPKNPDRLTGESIKESIKESISEAEDRLQQKSVIILNSYDQKSALKKTPPAMWHALKKASW